MTGIDASVHRYEAWLAGQLGAELVRDDLARKHKQMRAGVFPFLRATYWRWAEIIADLCPELMDAPVLLAVGDAHIDNFGTWRDADGRLVWGVNDFDDAAVMPYPLDLVRLAVSALVADRGGEADDIANLIWRGYRDGLDSPAPVILERGHRRLREALLLPEEARGKWWRKFDRPDEPIPVAFRQALDAAMPEPGLKLTTFARTAGVGSLGRPRFVAVADWRGGPVVREAKRLLASAWTVFAGGGEGPILVEAIAAGAHRAADPHYRLHEGLLVRRLSPNSRKIAVDDAGDLLAEPDMLRLMGAEIACCHAGDGARIDAVRADAARRKPGWLADAVRSAAQAVRRDFADFAA